MSQVGFLHHLTTNLCTGVATSGTKVPLNKFVYHKTTLPDEIMNPSQTKSEQFTQSRTNSPGDRFVFFLLRLFMRTLRIPMKNRKTKHRTKKWRKRTYRRKKLKVGDFFPRNFPIVSIDSFIHCVFWYFDLRNCLSLDVVLFILPAKNWEHDTRAYWYDKIF